jgi:hypothetical protein
MLTKPILTNSATTWSAMNLGTLRALLDQFGDGVRNTNIYQQARTLLNGRFSAVGLRTITFNNSREICSCAVSAAFRAGGDDLVNGGLNLRIS